MRERTVHNDRPNQFGRISHADPSTQVSEGSRSPCRYAQESKGRTRCGGFSGGWGEQEKVSE